MLGYQPYLASDSLPSRHPYPGPAPPLTPNVVILPIFPFSLPRLISQLPAELDSIHLLSDLCQSPEQRALLLSYDSFPVAISAIFRSSQSELITASGRLLRLLSRDFAGRQLISHELLPLLPPILSNGEVASLIRDLSYCPVTAACLRTLLPHIRDFLLTRDRCDASLALCLASAKIVDTFPQSAEVFVGHNVLSNASFALRFIAAVARASADARQELLDESSIVDIAVHVLGSDDSTAGEALEVLEALAIEPQGKRQMAKKALGVLAHLAGKASYEHRWTLHRLIRSLCEHPEFLFNFVEILQSEGKLLREILGNLALKPLSELLPGTLALEAFHEVLKEPGNPVMLAHWVCPKAAWYDTKAFVQGECVDVEEKLRNCGDVEVAKKCLRILM